KKPLLLAAAAVVLAIGAIHLFGPPLLEGKDRTVTAAAKAPTAVVAAIAPATPVEAARPSPAAVAAAGARAGAAPLRDRRRRRCRDARRDSRGRHHPGCCRAGRDRLGEAPRRR